MTFRIVRPDPVGASPLSGDAARRVHFKERLSAAMIAYQVGILNTQDPPIRIGVVLREEFYRLYGRSAGKDYQRAVHELEVGQSALCLSGGGIRSAAFGLGVLQGLARLGILQDFHYLSTVSGGGYIGSWLTAWRTRQSLASVLERLRWPFGGEGVAGESDRASDPLESLRGGTSYLTPRSGILGPDTWTALVLFTRNLCLVNLLILPLLAGILLGAKALLTAVVQKVSPESAWFPMATLAAVVLLVMGWILLASARPSWVRRPAPGAAARDYLQRVQAGTCLIFVASLAFAVAIAASANGDRQARYDLLLPSDWFGARNLYGISAANGALTALMCLVLGGLATALRSLVVRDGRPRGEPVRVRWLSFGVTLVERTRQWPVVIVGCLLAGLLGGAVIGLGIDLTRHFTAGGVRREALIFAVAPSWFILAFMASENLYLGVTTRKLPLPVPLKWNDQWGDEEREWVARTCGYLCYLAVCWSLFLLVTYFGRDILAMLGSTERWKQLIGIITAISAALGSIGLGASGLTRPDGTSSTRSRLPLRTIQIIATPVFLVILLAALSALSDTLLFQQSVCAMLEDPGVRIGGQPALAIYVASGLVLVAISASAAAVININRYSLHDLYRIRLVREFLGASHRPRKEDPWTGFDANDDMPFSLAWPPQDGSRTLYHVANVTLNNLEQTPTQWGYHKGEPFIFSPLFSGAASVHFRRTRDYGEDVRLGSAMAVSGASVSSNAGYSTLKGVGLLLTCFNLRLGVWAGNPSRSKWRRRGPGYALRPLLDEALMRTSDQSDYVYLSDGGHYDNLGMFEMLRRRCRFIVVSDATQDGAFAFSELGNAVRRANIEMNVRIEISTFALQNRPEKPADTPYCAVGTITYPETISEASGRSQEATGVLLYIKAAYHGKDEPSDVRAFAAAHPQFPHDPTSNQFFDETLFESYRALGAWIVQMLGSDSAPTSIEAFMRQARSRTATTTPPHPHPL